MKTSSSKNRILSALCLAGLFCAGVTLRAAGPAAAPAAPAVVAQATYATPDEAVIALSAALKADDTKGVFAIFGPQLSTVLSADPSERKAEYEAFTKAHAQGVKVVKVTDEKMVLNVGDKGWPLPFPLIKVKDGRWSFDTAAGREEILNRRIGENELGAINLMLRYVEAQREYASNDWDGDGVLSFAQRLVSTPGKKDGLYWSSEQDGTISPMAELVDEATQAGYKFVKTVGGVTQAYEGYVYKVLTRQGSAAPLGRYNYVINGEMIAGFGLVAFPVKYGNSGIMSFMVNQQGIVYQKDLGPNSVALGSAMTEYNPDSSWKPVEVETSDVVPVVGQN